MKEKIIFKMTNWVKFLRVLLSAAVLLGCW